MSVNTQVEYRELDQEWLELIITARELGLTVNEIRSYLNQISTQSASTSEMS